ncbi:MAG: DUF1223 domain-containing protein [Rhodanobacteraceae bacterium]
MRASILIGIVAIASATMPAFGQVACVARSGTTRAHLVELYTSEGCSSCPPADDWLNRIHDDSAIVPLAFHVDYWDSSRWRDRFSEARFTERQRVLAARSGSGVVYTPEVAVDGHEWGEWGHQALPSSLASSTGTLILHVAPGELMRVSLDVSGISGADARAYFAVTENGLVSRVQGGENRGVTLHHDHVVRAFAGPLALSRPEADLPLPDALDIATTTLVAFVQNPRSGEVAAVVQMPLAECANSKAR